MKPPITRFALAITGGTLVLMLADAVLAGFHLNGQIWRNVLADLLAATVLGYLVWAARASGWRLLAAAFLPSFVIRYFNALDEGVLFLAIPARLVIDGLVVGLITSALVAAAVVWLMGKGGNEEQVAAGQTPRRSPGAWLWRFAAGDSAYVVLYYAAGMCVFPFVKDFYANFKLPSPGAIVLMQVFRGSIYIASVLPIIRMIPNRRHATLAIGLALSMLAGVVPLLPDNPLMPPNIRLAHTVEIGVSNFIFGVILAYLFSPRAKPEIAPALTEGHAATT